MYTYIAASKYRYDRITIPWDRIILFDAKQKFHI